MEGKEIVLNLITCYVLKVCLFYTNVLESSNLIEAYLIK